MRPDHDLVDRVVPSPNHDERAFGDPDMLVLHYTGMVSAEAALERLTDAQAKVSSHYLIEEDGRILQLVPEARRAWHAGQGEWMGRRDINSRSIGIEIVNPGHEHGYRDFPAVQMQSVIDLCRKCVERWSIPPHFVIGHSDMAPDRKQDPGELFPWDQLSDRNIGRYVRPTPIAGGRFFGQGDRGEPVAAYQGLLAAFGYAVPIDGNFDETTRLATIAFQRRQRQSLVDGVADQSTIDTLFRALKAC